MRLDLVRPACRKVGSRAGESKVTVAGSDNSRRAVRPKFCVSSAIDPALSRSYQNQVKLTYYGLLVDVVNEAGLGNSF
jgi:hypothetical protein